MEAGELELDESTMATDATEATDDIDADEGKDANGDATDKDKNGIPEKSKIIVLNIYDIEWSCDAWCNAVRQWKNANMNHINTTDVWNYELRFNQ